MSRWLWLPFALLLSACASQAPLPNTTPTLELPLQLHVQRQQDQQRQDWLLVIQQDGQALRWSLLDPLGIPLARQRLEQGEWRNDGLLPPNPEARELFAALLFALTPRAELASRYAGQRWQAENSQRALLDGDTPRWRIDYRQTLDFELSTHGPRYRIQPLAGARP